MYCLVKFETLRHSPFNLDQLTALAYSFRDTKMFAL